jgi:hypothetical protein
MLTRAEACCSFRNGSEYFFKFKLTKAAEISEVHCFRINIRKRKGNEYKEHFM